MIKHKCRDVFQDLSHRSTSLPSHRRIFTNASTKDFPHREPPPRIWVIQHKENTSPLSNNNHRYTRGKAPNQQPPHHKRGNNKPKQRLQLSDLKDHKPLLMISKDHKLSFSPTQGSYRLDRGIAQV